MGDKAPVALIMSMMIYGNLLHRCGVKKIRIYAMSLEELQ